MKLTTFAALALLALAASLAGVSTTLAGYSNFMTGPVIYRQSGSACNTCAPAAAPVAVVNRTSYSPSLGGLFSGLCPWGNRREVAYAPVTVSNPCNSCAPACDSCQTAYRPVVRQSCRLEPQTCYRTVYTQQAVTVSRPVTTVDPCTGCPVTVMRPSTVVQQVAQRVPYTTYRQVCSPVCETTPSCTTCGTAGVTLGSSTCSNCTAAASTTPAVGAQVGYTTTNSGPATGSYAGGFAAQTNLRPAAPATTASPTLADEGFTSGGYSSEAKGPAVEQSPALPKQILRPNSAPGGSGLKPPQIVNPNDRVTQRVDTAAQIRYAGLPNRSSTTRGRSSADEDGWEASR